MDKQAMNTLLQVAFAPWDERSWDSLRDTYPEQAAALETAVRAGLTVEQMRDYCREHGYSERVGHWFAQAIQHLQRGEAAGPAIPPAADGDLIIDRARLKRLVEKGVDGRLTVITRDGQAALIVDAERGLRFAGGQRDQR